MTFDGFEKLRMDGDGAEIFLRKGGSGPPVLLLHGYPQTHLIWRHMAPRLAERFTVVTPDLRGYGASAKPPSDADHDTYSKRTMAADMVAVMGELGFERFAVVGHDRGARVTYRLALDHPDRVTRMASLDVVPTAEMWNGIDMKRALGGFHWQFLAQPAPKPEHMISADPDHWVDWLHGAWAAPGFEFDAAAMAAYKDAFRDPDVIRATCEDYRAGATRDHEHDEADLAADRKIECPILFLWGAVRGFGGPQGGEDPLNVWRKWSDSDVSGSPLQCGHFIPEEAPAEALEHLIPYLEQGGG